MGKWLMLSVAALLLAGCAAWGPTSWEFTVNPLFGDHMVMQRERQNPVWGTAEPGRSVVVEIVNRKYTAVADPSGKWLVKIDAVPAGGPYTMKIHGRGRTVEFKDILCGDVWICSGQSNMEWPLSKAADAVKEIAAADHPQLRLFTVAKAVSATPLKEVSGRWAVCSPNVAGSFSAIGYFFGRDLQKELNIPIGLVHTSWGGTPAEAWTDLKLLADNPLYRPIVERHQKQLAAYPERMKQYRRQASAYQKQIADFYRQHDSTAAQGNWSGIDFNDAAWQAMAEPSLWESQFDIDGMVLFRRTVKIPASWKGRDLVLSLGSVDDFDQTFFNGVKVGEIGPENPDAWRTPRRYTVPGKSVVSDHAVVAVRVFDHFGGGGFGGLPEDMFLAPVGGGEKISLAGDWKYKIALKLEPRKLNSPKPPYGPEHPHAPAGLFNAMIKPLVPLAIRGAIWYQGESNAGRAWQYRSLLSTMIACWRSEWNEGDFPFLIVQLANYMKPEAQPRESAWAELREAQQIVADKLPNCGIAAAIDIGEEKNIHPLNKQEVGRRLMLAARKNAYGRPEVSCGPTFKSFRLDGNRVAIDFTNVGGGLTVKSGKLGGFQIAGADRKFVWAEAVINGDTVTVGSPQVKAPQAVRYAWANNPVAANLYNKEGLPAMPFRTDTWPGLTDDKR